uniref:Uncharacterized protein n=1 Tax=Phalaenopsis aphrodite subsp. formosana TaxID=308872 RepID=Q3BAL4_PHAAO|nr:hypothetical protein PhapfoPp055 [Phalaenopsis aphrodite subsp. formosana]AAW82561.1 hypothetical protein [Phalaenopsis aphrodite subsp. formosana]
MAFATMTFPTTIFSFFKVFRLEIRNSTATKEERIVGFLVSMATSETVRSSLYTGASSFISSKFLVNLYSSHSLALPIHF